ncbi:hypothetical protein D9758_004229 [Tetrapyrgos nigripes]|uniref:Enoyl reductase (ER) domain-containing protein n=1 Tax=Tetrapyrgos nigripes TaxID=182062 RepID=A0A8H5LVL9_9AGAR|nr:hypothetical protein D9758_004229 [Tetrapyrgos nigripes]
MSEQKALVLESKQGRFVVSTRPKPTSVPAGELLVKIKASALNPADWKVQDFGPAYIEKYPAVLGSDIAGDVETVGEGVTGFSKGDRVLCQSFFVNNEYAGFQQYTLVPAEIVAKIPENLSYSQAASVPLGLTTASVGLFSNEPTGLGLDPSFDLNVKHSGPVLVIGASTSVGQFSIQLLRLVKLSPIIAYASAHQFDYLKSLGATEFIDRKQVSFSDLPAAVKKITSEPIKLVYDAFSSAESEQAGYDILADGGTIIVTTGDQIKNKVDGKKVLDVLGSVHPPTNREFGKAQYRNLTKYLQDGTIVPNRTEELPNGLAGIPDGLERLKNNQVSGIKLISLPQETA